MEDPMNDIKRSGTYLLGDKSVHRMGYGTMQLAGPEVFGPPKDKQEALSVLREAIDAGVNHIDTSDFYGPHITNQIIKEALAPYPTGLVIATKVGAIRGVDGSWISAQKPADLVQGVYDNLRNLGVDVLDVVNLRIIGEGLSLAALVEQEES
jgi:pyridoxine 4-dehydrogenase